MADAKRGADSANDGSMEEILQSIRRIIAEEGDEPKAAAAPAKPEDLSSVNGSAVLELTDVLKEDGSIVHIAENDAPAEKPMNNFAAMPDSAPVNVKPASSDVLDHIDSALDNEPAKPAAKVEAVPSFTPPSAAARPAAPAPAAAPAVVDDSLLSQEAANASAAAFKRLPKEPVRPMPSIPSPVFRSGNTVEDLVMESLKPMLKEWLDANLPGIVERVVEREIRKLTHND